MDKTLSRDVLILVIRQLSLQNLLNFSLTCHSINDLCEPFLFVHLHMNWDELDKITSNYANNGVRDRRVHYLRDSTSNADSRGEWVASPKLSIIDEMCADSLQSLEVKCALKSSGWLKYIKAPLFGIKSLRFTVSSPFQNQTFDFSHISQTFPNLENISLGDSDGGFTIDPNPELGLRNLRSIDAQNCEWHFPSKLNDAVAHGNLQVLSISFSVPMHPFAFSERFRTEFASLPDSLEELRVIVNIGKRLSWNPLKRSCPLPKSKFAELRGFDYTYRPETDEESYNKFPILETLLEY